MLDKTYNPATAEARQYQRWEEAGAFRRGNRPDSSAFTIVIPPPNVTGRLHMGHALNNTLQDILITLYIYTDVHIVARCFDVCPEPLVPTDTKVHAVTFFLISIPGSVDGLATLTAGFTCQTEILAVIFVQSPTVVIDKIITKQGKWIIDHSWLRCIWQPNLHRWWLVPG